jgi:hypothetical protein
VEFAPRVTVGLLVETNVVVELPDRPLVLLVLSVPLTSKVLPVPFTETVYVLEFNTDPSSIISTDPATPLLATLELKERVVLFETCIHQ